jgi:hypothetical protein
MSNGGLLKVTAKTAAEVCKQIPVSDEGKKLLRDGIAPKQFLDQLLEKKNYPDAANFLAMALPKREAVWWACLCARSAHGPNQPMPVNAALQAAEKWVKDPSEDNRRPTHAAAEAAELSTPAGCAALAAFFSGGSLGPATVAAIPPKEHLTAVMVGVAVVLAAVIKEPQKAEEKYKGFFTTGIAVANGTNRWS